ncbi:E3 ubiquitin-protein ligase WAV3-like [Phoenix dactylifera]|uniref:E3 ubiquitin-protein ligase WAV3-like n=1 Tax=Phoenix dactylifera TaxID=42345 RepID=A0A8B7D0S3_PHODC|nr:E3 ubiquitin-protein ligase WAV3-like [Phoenix dactylifera]
MGTAWRRAKRALAANLCVYIPGNLDDDGGSPFGGHAAGRSSNAAAASSPTSSGGVSDYRELMPTTPTPTSSGLRLPRSGSRSSKRTCAICLGTMKAGHGHALFTAECSHTFHFHCIASNVKHGNRVCPVCRAKWKEIPFQGPPYSEHPHGRARVNPVNWPQEEGFMTVVRRFSRADSANRQHHLTPLFHTSEPIYFNDDEPLEPSDEPLDLQPDTTRDSQHGRSKTVEIKTYPEFSAIPQSASQENFTVLIHLKAPHPSTNQVSGRNVNPNSTASQTSRAPVDLVTVLDVSGSMAGTKLALLKRAMGFVIQNLGPSDRLSVIAFSSTARRLFHLCRMSDSGKQQALQAVNSLAASGGTNIAEGLRKGAKVIEERREKNPVCSIILLSDGQDTYTVTSSAGGTLQAQSHYESLVPSSIRGATSHQTPVHSFGFGSDHDSSSMHSISEISGGTFSFIETEGVIQDAFAQCIGGLLSVVVQEMLVGVECVHPGVQLAPIKSGGYASKVAADGRSGSIDVGDLYADEERDFMVSVNIPPAHDEFVLLKVGCSYRDPVLNETINLEGKELRIPRPAVVVGQMMSIEVDRERNRVQAAEAMAAARAAAERGALADAVSILEERRRILSKTLAGRSSDQLCLALDAELKEMQDRMASRQRYEASGRAYMLSGLSSHSWQRATVRGDSTDSTSLIHAYQTPSMVDMLERSQTLSPSPRLLNPPLRPARSFSAQLQLR